MTREWVLYLKDAKPRIVHTGLPLSRTGETFTVQEGDSSLDYFVIEVVYSDRDNLTTMFLGLDSNEIEVTDLADLFTFGILPEDDEEDKVL